MRFLTRSLLGLFMTALSVAMIVFAAATLRDALREDDNGGQSGFGARERVFAVNVVTIEPGVHSPVLTAFGEVVSRRSLQMRVNFREKVVWIHPNMVEGGRVSQGAVLVRFDQTSAQENLALAQASLFEAQAELQDAENLRELAYDELAAARDQAALRERASERQRDLIARGVGTEAAREEADLAASAARQSVLTRRQAVQTAEARIVQATSQVNRAQIALEKAERDLNERTLYAPYDGVLSDVSIIVGREVSESEVIAELIDPDALEVAFRVSTADYQRFMDQAGGISDLRVTVALDVLGADFTVEGRITRQSLDVGEGQTGRRLFASLSDGEATRALRAGDFVRVTIEERPLAGVALLPASALGPSGTVLVLGQEDRLEEEPVNLVHRPGNEVLVRARELAGRNVVAERSPFLGSGIKVRPLQDNLASEARGEEPRTIALSSERRAALIAFVEANNRMPPQAKERILVQLRKEQVPAQVVEGIERRMGG